MTGGEAVLVGDNDTVSAALRENIEAWISAYGPMPFEQFVELALYDPEHGFYSTSGRAGGRRGDFVTSVEVGPLFAAVVADWLDRAWNDAGRPREFRVSEVGAGVGTLYRGIHRAAPECRDALLYTLVERSASMRQTHESLPTQRWRSSTQLPDETQHAVVANELLDNLAFGIAERVPAGWAPVFVTLSGGDLVFVAGEPDTALDRLTVLAPSAAVGDRVPVATEAAQWVAHANALAQRVLCFDYGAPTAELAARPHMGWLRTYAAHAKGHNPFAAVGGCDITHDVPIDQIPTPELVMTQADWLRSNGLGDRVDVARATWAERGHIGDLAAIAARSAIGEAEALTDPAGLGAFVVLEWSGGRSQRS